MMKHGKVLRRVGNIRDIDKENITSVEIEGKSVLLIKKGDEVFAIDSVCGEGCGPLDDGMLEGFHIRCPWYHEYYDIRTGKPLGVAHCRSGIKTYETRVNETNGDIFVYMEVSN
ncbi:MAG: Rieske 2Fe-2S domain-containing protein [Thaumarchaeota archaeon]|nr:Rieske 2Fe-2S domain-containing protein [Nitrososphaerota archaeon]MDE1873308.1 Rieske 2Fe-2S domain-containing protein [Nitrososphaerota archaeon]